MKSNHHRVWVGATGGAGLWAGIEMGESGVGGGGVKKVKGCG